MAASVFVCVCLCVCMIIVVLVVYTSQSALEEPSCCSWLPLNVWTVLFLLELISIRLQSETHSGLSRMQHEIHSDQQKSSRERRTCWPCKTCTINRMKELSSSSPVSLNQLVNHIKNHKASETFHVCVKDAVRMQGKRSRYLSRTRSRFHYWSYKNNDTFSLVSDMLIVLLAVCLSSLTSQTQMKRCSNLVFIRYMLGFGLASLSG